METMATTFHAMAQTALSEIAAVARGLERLFEGLDVPGSDAKRRTHSPWLSSTHGPRSPSPGSFAS